MDQFIGAFAGAFFAFLFIRIGLMFTHIYERQNKNYNALVKLEYELNRLMNDISTNCFNIASINKVLEKCKEPEQKQIPISFNKLHKINIEREILLSFTNIDFINDLHGYFSEIDKINLSIQTVNEFYQAIKDGIITKTISIDEYKTNAIYHSQQLVELNKFLRSLEEQTKKLAGKTRILQRKKPLFSYVVIFFSKNKYPKDIEKQLQDELKKINSEIETTKRESAREIKETIGE